MFDILPLYGTLKPGETEQMTFTFFGHRDTRSEARAVCEVRGGPAYSVTLRGEASLVQYCFDSTQIDFGKQVGVEVWVIKFCICRSAHQSGTDFNLLSERIVVLSTAECFNLRPVRPRPWVA